MIKQSILQQVTTIDFTRLFRADIGENHADLLPADAQALLLDASISGNLNDVKKALVSGANIQATGSVPVSHAASIADSLLAYRYIYDLRYVSVVNSTYLNSFSRSVPLRQMKRVSALHEAAQNGHVEVTKRLLLAGRFVR